MELNEINQTLKKLKQEFKITVIREVTTFVGFKIMKNQETIKLVQTEYTERVLEQCKMQNSKPLKVLNQKTEQINRAKRQKLSIQRNYWKIAVFVHKTRPDIVYGVNLCSRCVQESTQERIRDMKHVLKYLNGKMRLGLQYKSSGKRNMLEAYCNVDYAGYPETRKSTSGYVIFYAEGLIS